MTSRKEKKAGEGRGKKGKGVEKRVREGRTGKGWGGRCRDKRRAQSVFQTQGIFLRRKNPHLRHSECAATIQCVLQIVC